MARGARLEQFTGFLFTGCVSGGVAWWLVQTAGPAWAVYPTVAGAAFFSVAALGYLLTAIVSAFNEPGWQSLAASECLSFPPLR